MSNPRPTNPVLWKDVLREKAGSFGMDNYRKGKQVEDVIDRDKIPIPNLSEDFTWMQVAHGSKIRNLLDYAIKSMEMDKQVVWTGVGASVGKAISCAEILKRKFNAHQITKICYSKVEDHWDPCNPEMETLIVMREIPTVHILVSRQGLDVSEAGYQAPSEYESFWKSSPSQKPKKSRENSQKAKKRAQFLKQITSHE